MTTHLDALKVKIFADGAELAGIADLAREPWIRGFTTNPTLMRKAGVSDYKAFAREALTLIGDRPISFEVFSDEFSEMEAQAKEIASWGANINVKIPVTNTRREFAGPLISRLSAAGVPLNITAIMTVEQVRGVMDALRGTAPAFVSVFAGRIADTGRDPLPIMTKSLAMTQQRAETELIWASPRELLNVFQASDMGCDVITVTNDILKKLSLVEKNLDDFSLETVQMFRNDAVQAGFRIDVKGA